jgi:hypothetical protein
MKNEHNKNILKVANKFLTLFQNIENEQIDHKTLKLSKEVGGTTPWTSNTYFNAQVLNLDTPLS